jgi:putative membrane protein
MMNGLRPWPKLRREHRWRAYRMAAGGRSRRARGYEPAGQGDAESLRKAGGTMPAGSSQKSTSGAVRRFVISTIATAVAIALVVTFLPSYLHASGGVADLIKLALIFGVVNGLIGPVIRFLALPVRIATLGLASVAINAALLLLVASLADRIGLDFVVGKYPPTLFAVETLVAALIGSLVLGIVNTAAHFVTRD